MEAKRLLKNVQVLFISLVDKGANRRTVIWKSKDGQKPVFEREIPIIKVDEEKRLVYGIVYAPDEPDTQGDMMTAEEIEKMAYSFMLNRRTDQVDRQHDYNPDEGFVAESWIIRQSDPLFPMEKEGAWAVGIKVTQDETWKLIKSGDVAGLSMGGFASAEEIGKEEIGKKDKGEKMKEGEERGMLDKIKQGLSNFFRGEPLEKDFNEQFEARNISEAIWALNDALSKILNDEEIEDKKAAINESVNQFLTFINGDLLMEKEDKKEMNGEERGAKSEEEIKKQEEEQPSETKKKLDELLNKITALEERLAKVEKAHPGRKSAEGRDENSNGQDQDKGYKGLRIV